MPVKMSREKYIEYLRTQVYWINQLADELEVGVAKSTWGVDFEMMRPEVIKERELKESA